LPHSKRWPKFNTAPAGAALFILTSLHAVGFTLVLRSKAMMRLTLVVAAAIVLSLGGLAGYILPLL
jgi:hypothetical protein